MAMIKKLLLSLGVIFTCISITYAQSTFKGTVTDNSRAPLAYATVTLKQEGKVVNLSYTDSKGEYQMFGVTAGTYDIEVTGPVGCANTVTQTDIPIGSSDVKFINFEISCATDLGEVVVRYEIPNFNPDETKVSQRISGDDVAKMPGRSLSKALASMEGVTSVDGSISSVRGNRSDGQQTIIDGVRVRGNSGVSMSSIEEMELISGGIPAEYGDGTSFTVITTRGVSKELHGSAEIRGSVEGYNNFLGAVSLTGPILRGKDKRNDPARIGFLFSGEITYDRDASPAYGGTWYAKPEVLDALIENPLRYDPVNLGVNYSNAEFLQDGSFDKKRVRRNADNWSYILQGKIDFLLGSSNNIRLSLGGSYEYLRGKSWGRQNALFNNDFNPITTNSTMRLNARFNHRVYTNNSDTSLLKNIMYDINVNYTLYNSRTEDSELKDKIFRYGHVGYFNTHKKESYSRENFTDTNGMVYHDYNVFQGYYDSLSFRPGPYNPILTRYTENFVDLYPADVLSTLSNLPYDQNMFYTFGALLNGDAPSSVYSMYNLPGIRNGSYSKSQLSSIGAKASLAMNIGNHELKLGFEFEKLTSRGFSTATRSLWTAMRNAQNSHMAQLDVTNPILRNDTIFFNQLVNLSQQSTFDRNLRQKLGLDPNGSDWLDVDSYDPDIFSLDMFSAQELLTGTGSDPLVSYFGYDYNGMNKNRRKTSIRDFFSADQNGVRNYAIGAYEPVYMALYLQDKFSIQSLLFNVGVRIDRFDANQEVLKDPYLFRPAHTVSSLKAILDPLSNQDQLTRLNSAPSEDAVVYVNQKGTNDHNINDVSILGYRIGNRWYNNEGQEVLDPERLLGANGGPLLPWEYRVDDENNPDPANNTLTKVHPDAFEDYKAQWSVMPRISFSFPVSDNSIFTAHYNIITNRPTNLQLAPVDYLFIEKFGTNSNYLINNPNLKPQQSIDYEIGFRQKVGEKSSVGITAYYSEKRDQIQAYRYTGAYPSTYYSYANLDFGTVQGFSFSYNLARTRNVSLRASYTIQFAKGTGSSAGSNLAIIASGQPNLRTLTNLSFDQRHAINLTLDYSFDGGTQYNGPTTVKEKDGKSKTIKWLENTGLTVRARAASGLPYSRSRTPYSDYVAGTASQLSGSINGSHRPWMFTVDLRLQRSFLLNLSKKDSDGVQRNVKPAFLTVYIDVENIFNIKNIINVYTYTGNPDDDGYLSATEYQRQINSQIDVASYINYYTMLVQNPYNYASPARVSLGVQFGF